MNQKGVANINLIVTVMTIILAAAAGYFVLSKPDPTLVAHEQPPAPTPHPTSNPISTSVPSPSPTPEHSPTPTPSPSPTTCYRCDVGVYDTAKPPKSLSLTGDTQNSHDPVIIEVDKNFYSFSTGPNIQIKTSPDLLNWKLAGQLFDGSPPRPEWLQKKVPGVTDLWAPDVSYFGGAYHIYYAANGGPSRPANCIGHATAVNFNFEDFVDQGPVICTNDDGIIDDDWSAIDPNVIIDEKGKSWLALGSFGSGIKMIELDQTGARANDKLYSIASRAQHNSDAAIEAPFIVRRGSYYYLFVSWGYCCRGVNSTYNIRVGRSKNVLGPYLDKNGKAMMDGGGTLVLAGNQRWRGPGHNAILFSGKRAYNIYHSYDAESKDHNGVAGVATLRISELAWDTDDWPISGGP